MSRIIGIKVTIDGERADGTPYCFESETATTRESHALTLASREVSGVKANGIKIHEVTIKFVRG